MDLKLGVERIRELAKKNGVSVNKMLVSDLKLSKSVVDNMLKGSVPSADKLEAIARYLDVSTDYLLGRTDDPTPMGAKKVAPDWGRPENMRAIQLAQRILSLPPESLERVMGYLDSLEDQGNSQGK